MNDDKKQNDDCGTDSEQRQVMLEVNECCGDTPAVYNIRLGDWVVHCRHCCDGTDPYPSANNAIEEWNKT